MSAIQEQFQDEARKAEIKRRIGVLLTCRQAARTDLLYLCNTLLGYKDVSRLVHGEILDHLQHFKGGTESIDAKGNPIYEPAVPIWQLEGERNRLIVFPRGHL